MITAPIEGHPVCLDCGAQYPHKVPECCARLKAQRAVLLTELEEVLNWAVNEKAPLGELEIASIRGAIKEAKS